MNRAQLEQMDPHMLMSILNSKLRAGFESLEALMRANDLEEVTLVYRLKQAGYLYDEEQNQFRTQEATC